MSLMDHHILTVGTFGLWGALLATPEDGVVRGLVLMPAEYRETVEVNEVAKANATWLKFV
jgi:hypothetical protein